MRADLRVLHPAISRAHVILRCVDGQWTAIDNDSPDVPELVSLAKAKIGRASCRERV